MGMMVDTPRVLQHANNQGHSIMLEGAQGFLLDIDHGTYPYVTSSSTTTGSMMMGAGVGPSQIDTIIGVVKSYSTRVGAGPFPTELLDDTGHYLCVEGHEFGTTTGRRRRTGWLDLVALRRAIEVNSISSLCITKLDVLDSLKEIKICVRYLMPDGHETDSIPITSRYWHGIKPVYEVLPGWEKQTAGLRRIEDLPQAALAYIKRIENLVHTPIDIISTGPDRNDIITIGNFLNI
jgi:adenylosuccinate synthase